MRTAGSSAARTCSPSSGSRNVRGGATAEPRPVEGAPALHGEGDAAAEDAEVPGDRGQRVQRTHVAAPRARRCGPHPTGWRRGRRRRGRPARRSSTRHVGHLRPGLEAPREAPGAERVQVIAPGRGLGMDAALSKRWRATPSASASLLPAVAAARHPRARRCGGARDPPARSRRPRAPATRTAGGAPRRRRGSVPRSRCCGCARDRRDRARPKPKSAVCAASPAPEQMSPIRSLVGPRPGRRRR